MEKKKRVWDVEAGGMDALEKGHTDFEQEYYRYLCETSLLNSNINFELQELIQVMDEQKLIRAILNLKKHEYEILTARVFGEQDFTEIGLKHRLTAKQAEMAYYYIIRKLRKVLEGRRYE